MEMNAALRVDIDEQESVRASKRTSEPVSKRIEQTNSKHAMNSLSLFRFECNLRAFLFAYSVQTKLNQTILI